MNDTRNVSDDSASLLRTISHTFHSIRQWAQSTYGTEITPKEIHLLLSDGKWLVLPFPEFQHLPKEELPQPFSHLRPKSKAIFLAASFFVPKTTRTLANEIDSKIDNDFYRCLKQLVDEGFLIKVRGGYLRGGAR